MTQTFKQGDKVSWNTAQGKTVGKVVKKLTSRTEIKGHTVAASKDQYSGQFLGIGLEKSYPPHRVQV